MCGVGYQRSGGGDGWDDLPGDELGLVLAGFFDLVVARSLLCGFGMGVFICIILD